MLGGVAIDDKETRQIHKTNKKLHSSIKVTKVQNEQFNDMNHALANIDDIISLKTKFIESLEQELERLECLESAGNSPVQTAQQAPRKSIAYASVSSTSSTSSTSSVLTSISSVSNSRAAAYNATLPCYQQQQQASQKMMIMPGAYTSYGGSGSSSADNESDTGISSANSDDFSTQLETLV